jgi:hypothetical protein
METSGDDLISLSIRQKARLSLYLYYDNVVRQKPIRRELTPIGYFELISASYFLFWGR